MIPDSGFRVLGLPLKLQRWSLDCFQDKQKQIDCENIDDLKPLPSKDTEEIVDDMTFKKWASRFDSSF